MNEVQLVAEDWAELLQLALGLGTGGNRPRRGSCTVHQSGGRVQTRVVEHCFRLGDRVRRGRSPGRGVIVEVEFQKVGIGREDGRVLAILPSNGDARSDKIRRNH